MAIKTLLLSGGEIHDWRGNGAAIKDALETDGGFDLTYVENDLSALEGGKLDPYELIVFYFTVGSITDAQKNGLLNHIASGKGYAGAHSAADSIGSAGLLGQPHPGSTRRTVATRSIERSKEAITPTPVRSAEATRKASAKSSRSCS